MATTIKRKAASFRLPNYLLEGLKTEARRQHRSVNNLVEVVLLKSLYNEPNAETLAAMKELMSFFVGMSSTALATWYIITIEHSLYLKG